MIPASLSQHLATFERSLPRADHAVRAGDLRVVAGDTAPAQLVLVLDVDRHSESVQVTLAHPYIELATEHDLILSPELTGLSYEVVVQSDIRGVVWTRDLGRLAGEAGLEVVEACFQGPDHIPSDDKIQRGVAMIGPLDSRWSFKVSQGRELQALSSNCAAALLDADDPWQLNVDEIFQTLLAPAPDADLMILALFELWLDRGQTLMFTLDHVELLTELELLDQQRWSTTLGEVGQQFHAAVLLPLIEHARSTTPANSDALIRTIGANELRAMQPA